MAITAAKQTRAKHQSAPQKINLEQTLRELEEWLETQSTFSNEYQNATIAEMLSIVTNTEGATMILKDPKALYVGNLKATLQRLQDLENPFDKTQTENTRKTILERLQTNWGAVKRAERRLDWGRLPCLISHPDDETLPQAHAARYLFVWPDNEDGQALDQFSCLTLGLWWCNTRLGIPAWNMEEQP
jgi:hypothetical protein